MWARHLALVMRPAPAVVLAGAGLGLVRGEATGRRLGGGDEDGGYPGPEVTCSTAEAAVPAELHTKVIRRFPNLRITFV